VKKNAVAVADAKTAKNVNAGQIVHVAVAVKNKCKSPLQRVFMLILLVFYD